MFTDELQTNVGTAVMNDAQFPRLAYEYSYIQTSGRNVGRLSKRWKDEHSLKRGKLGVACNLLPLLR